MYKRQEPKVQKKPSPKAASKEEPKQEEPKQEEPKQEEPKQDVSVKIEIPDDLMKSLSETSE